MPGSLPCGFDKRDVAEVTEYTRSAHLDRCHPILFAYTDYLVHESGQTACRMLLVSSLLKVHY